MTRYLSHHHKDILTIGFARRFATYKRATLLFKDLERLERLVNDPDRPVLLVFAGKAHPNDVPGQQFLKQLFTISMRPEFQGRLILLEDYNLSMTRELIPGVDVWLNNPEYPLEACGTSGMKAAINGVINLSVLDGWWDEAYNGENGWAITPYPELDHDAREQQEAEDLLNILEHRVIPAYYTRNSQGEPEAWVTMSKASMKSVLPQFNTIRMARDYLCDLYRPAAKGGQRLSENHAAGAIELARWKKKIEEGWSGLRAQLTAPLSSAVKSGETLSIDIEVETNGLAPDDIRVECLLVDEANSDNPDLAQTVPFKQVGSIKDEKANYHTDLFETDELCSAGGLHNFKIRIYPYHPLLSHPFECGRMLWL
jgi:starch phosphorylase